MFVQIASYRLGSGSVDDLARRVEEGNLPVLRDTPGFIDYYGIDLGDGVVASVMVVADRSVAEEAERRLTAWVEKTMEEFQVTPVDVVEGDVIASSRP